MIRRWMIGLAMLIAAWPAMAQRKAPLVLAAASLQESMNAAADAWAAKRHPRPVLSFAASSALARQVEAGGKADLFASADEEWMDELAKRALIVPATRVDFVRNRLVIVAPLANRLGLSVRTLATKLSAGPLAMADPDAVPAGRYGKQALTTLGAWPRVAPHVVRADSVRSALALVERGAAPYGIVYATDARASRAVRVAGIFPASSHSPIVYPVARIATATNPEGEAFRRFLLSGEARAIFARFGFARP